MASALNQRLKIMKNTNLFILFSFIVILQAACKSPISVDANYCRFNTNGTSYNAGCSGPFDNCINAIMYPQYKSITVTANSGTGSFFFTILDSTMQFNSGTYVLNTQRLNCANYKDYSKSGRYSYLTDSTHVGYVNIKFDKINYRISGTFAINAKYELDTEKVNITNGVFSIKYTVD